MKDKEKNRKRELAKLKQEIRQEAWDENRYYCQGCGEGKPLDCSHILSVAQRKDLECEKENINLFCRDCHNKWESGEDEKRRGLLTYEKDMEYIEKNRKVYTPPFDAKANKTIKQLNDRMNKFLNK